MASINILKDIQIKQAKPKDKNYSFNDGGGLRLKVTPGGNKVLDFQLIERLVNLKNQELFSL
ncbi:Arm DNA-binding domain-containing protein [Aliarcobacter butzleri]|uniref:Arm DNA-binding domain-containing protein n=1 Tax=Aliarcobacter butzleri TaxID=28197 RepID=A0AAW7PXE2_9BACT|nr:Arm DNA-binding domain-containing protein [Aliarcobacter butzleri]MCG3668045.1 Arm DNA-binding domain-containing protein [Aliarcobacter butzleri]MDN5070340.1 Arm DNA-binding domain-containing protein [Aliarcobacter butzleri]MDN5102580.1 Arm DNA-binding domain-containing protein [Aliarcobacter butzleri]